MTEQQINNPPEQTDNPVSIFKTIIDMSIDGFCILTPDAKLKEVNSSFCNMLGYTREELLAITAADLEANYTPQQVTQRITSVMKKGYKRFKTQHHCKNGRIINTEVSMQYCNCDKEKFLFCFIRDITEVKQSKKQLHSIFRAVDQCGEGLAVVDLNGNIEYINKAFAEMHGYTPAELLGKNLSVFHSPQQMPAVLDANQQIIKTGSFDGEIWHTRKDKTAFPGHMNNVLLRDNADNPIGIIGTLKDITQRKKADNELYKSEELLRAILESSNNCILVCDKNYNYIYANNSAVKYVGLTKDKVVGKNMVDALGHIPGFMHLWMSRVDQAFKTGQTMRVEDSGFVGEQLVHSESVLYPLKDINGNMFAVSIVYRDVTENKKAQDKLKASEARFRTLSDVAVEAIAIHENGQVLDINKRYVDMFGYTLDELRTTGILNTVTEDCRKIIAEKIASGYEGTYEVVCLRKDKSTFPVEIQVKQMQLKNRTFRVASIRDITEKKQIEAERETYKDTLLKAQKHAYIDSMGAIVAHQVNQPLTKINILLDRAIEKLEKTTGCENALKDIKEGLDEAKEAANIIRKFRQSSKGLTLNGVSKVNVSTIADNIIDTLADKARQARIGITTENLLSLPEVQTHETALEQIFLIIIQNSIEAADGKNAHQLNITGEFANSNIQLKFEDDCCGISPENLPKIFDPFFSTKTEDKGMGLGLDIVQQILTSCGGQIHVESTLDKGTAFYITLPTENTLGT